MNIENRRFETEIELLVRAVIEDEGRFLIAHTKGANNLFLPGGHIEPGEGMRSALARELREELGIEAEVGRYLGTIEHAWEAGGTRNHEINHCFVVTGHQLDANRNPTSREDQVEFLWLSGSELEERNLQPAPLQELLSNWDEGSSQIWWASTIGSDHT